MTEFDAAWEWIVGEFILPGHAELQERPSGLFVARDTLLGDLVAAESERAGTDPYAWDGGMLLYELRAQFAIADPRTQARVMPISWVADWPMPPEDPGLR